MSLARFTVRRPVATCMAALAVFLFGLLSLERVSLDLLPDLSYPAITIEVPFAGASPQEVESLIVRPLEDAVSVSQGLVRLRSTCLAGQARVSLLFRWGTRMDVAALEVREKLQQVELPEGAEAPRVLRFDPGLEPILRVALRPREDTGKAGLIALRLLAEERIKPALERLEGVAAARVRGGLEEEVRVHVDPRAASLAGVTLEEIGARLAAESVNLAGGTLSEGKLEYRIRTLNELRELDELRNVVIAQRPEGPLRLGQLATVKRGEAERQVITRLDGQEAIELAIFKASGRNTVAVADASLARLKELGGPRGLLADARWVVTSDQSAFIRSSLADLASTAWTGGLLAVLVLLLFLRDLRSTLTVAFAIPLSLVATFLLMRWFDVTLNVMSLSGIALAIGMLVDNAIVVLESIAREREGMSPALAPDEAAAQAAVRGTEAVSQAVIASTLTTLSVFLPILFVEGVASRLFADQAFTIVFALLASLIASLSVIPMLAASRALERPLRWVGVVVEFVLTPLRWLHERAWNALAAAYPRVLAGALARPLVVLIVALLLTLGAMERVTRLGADFLPDMHPGIVQLELSLPRGASLRQTDLTLARVCEAAQELDEVEAVFATAGSIRRAGEPDELRENAGQVLVRLVAGSGAEGEARVTAALRERVAQEPGLQAPVFRKAGLVSVQAPLEVLIEGRELDALEQGAEGVLGALTQIPGLTDLRSSARGGRPEIRVALDRGKLALYELDAASVSQALEVAVRGRVSADLVRSDRDLPIRVVLDPEARTSVSDLERIVISPAGADPILLRSVGKVRVERGPAEIRREGQRRVALVRAEVSGRDLSSAARDVEVAIADLTLPPGTFAHTGGSAEELSSALRGLAFAIAMAILLVYLVLAAQFESFLHPLIILGSVPLAGAGAALGLWLTGTPLSVVVLIGVVVLAGIVVNNAILLVDRVNQLRREDASSLDEALLAAGRDRLRPIVMTTATTVLGLLPLVLVPGDGAELRVPLAVTLISGLLASTILTLVVVPCAYRLLGRAAGSSQEPALVEAAEPEPPGPAGHETD